MGEVGTDWEKWGSIGRSGDQFGEVGINWEKWGSIGRQGNRRDRELGRHGKKYRERDTDKKMLIPHYNYHHSSVFPPNNSPHAVRCNWIKLVITW